MLVKIGNSLCWIQYSLNERCACSLISLLDSRSNFLNFFLYLMFLGQNNTTDSMSFIFIKLSFAHFNHHHMFL